MAELRLAEGAAVGWREGVETLAGGILFPAVGRGRETPTKATELFHLSFGKKAENEEQSKCAMRDRFARLMYIMQRKRPSKRVSPNSE